MFRNRETLQKVFVWIIVAAMVLALLAGAVSIFSS